MISTNNRFELLQTELTLVPVESCPYPEKVIHRFLRKIENKTFVNNQECLLWVGAKDCYGYGLMRINGSIITAHRLSYEIYKGEIPYRYDSAFLSGSECLFVLHTCDVPACVNPLHLYAGTAKQNARDREDRNRGNYVIGETHYSVTLSNEQVIEILYLYYKENMILTDLAKKYNTPASTLNKYISGYSRPDITKPYLDSLTSDELSSRGHALCDSQVLEIFRLRHEQHESVETIVKMFGIGKSSVYKYLSGETKPHVFHLYVKQCRDKFGCKEKG